jgi:acyl-coenzyme A synthetase/AMP-(fatty) acid ligase
VQDGKTVDYADESLPFLKTRQPYTIVFSSDLLAEAAVVGHSDEVTGEVIGALVVLKGPYLTQKDSQVAGRCINKVAAF